MALTANPLTWIIAPPLDLYSALPHWYHVIATVVLIGLVVDTVRRVVAELKLGYIRESTLDAPEFLSLALTGVMTVVYWLIAAALWWLALPLLFVLHDKLERDFLKVLNRLFRET